MKKTILFAAAAIALPFAAHAMPVVGDHVGTSPDAARTALASAGCTVSKFEAEGGKIEAKCHDASNKRWEIYIDPKSGNVTKIKADD
ncbi:MULTISPECIES: PepSY domain-containing protein [Cohaesibacter]|uniref:PepSY domain-containing protein n=1 Tax=Cohaesibacter TaxID=655352 RepID=UPI000DEBC58A|nr:MULTISPECIES: PepSY domain-containing protein [Cohaesibacter]TLP48171.1 PepSY domain-containing protein [Cohaesibacter sp. CAU 1516]